MTDEAAERSQYFAIHEALGDNAIWAMVRINDGIYEQWTGGDKWVDMPLFAGYFWGEELGARPIGDCEVESLKETLDPPLSGVVAMMRGRP